MNGESETVDSEAVENWLERLKNIIALHEPSDIFNADETELFFKCLPNKKFNLTVEKFFNWEKSKECFQSYSQLV